MSAFRRLDVCLKGDVTVVTLLDRDILAPRDIVAVGDELLGLAEEPDCKKVLIVFRNVQSLAVSLCGDLIRLQGKLKDRGGRLVLCEISDWIWENFELVKMTYVFRRQPTEQAGLDDLQ